MKKKLIVRLKGGIGNQLCTYAAARRLSNATGAELIIDDLTGFQRDFIYKRTCEIFRFSINARRATYFERLGFAPRASKRLLKSISSLDEIGRKLSYIDQEGLAFDPRLLNFNFNNIAWLEGYWQSENYFCDISEIIRNELRLNETPSPANLEVQKRIDSEINSCAVHVRSFDKHIKEGSTNIGPEYYNSCIQRIESRSVGTHYFVFSDDFSLVKEYIKIPKDRMTLVSLNSAPEDSIWDMWLMRRCKVLAIANSTFSWWAAWLSNSKEVYVPGKRVEGLANWGFDGLIPPGWIKVE